MPVFLLSEKIAFPSPYFASAEGLLAVGGDLRTERLLLAYRLGIFPWFSEEEPILWWSPDPRLVLFPEELHVSRSLGRVIRRRRYEVTADQAFSRVIRECARVRLEKKEGTWIGGEMIRAYEQLHADGYAHSVESWQGGRLVGGLYGVSLGGCFFGESMFARRSDASKVALVALVTYLEAQGFDFVDCQVTTEHLKRLGAREIPRASFLERLARSLARPTRRGRWVWNATRGGA